MNRSSVMRPRVLVAYGEYWFAWYMRRLAERPDIGADALATDLRARDDSDMVRMQPAEDALEIDTSDLDVADVVDQIEKLVRARLPA